MKKIIPQIFVVLLCLSAQAQKVSNIRAEQRGQDIVVLYLLEATTPCEVNLLLSQDDGSTWSAPLKNVLGDVGKNILDGEKQIIWKVLEEQEQLVGDNMKFKVIAIDKKSFEPEMVFVEGGTFVMGVGDVFGKTIHSLDLKPFYIGKYEVTQVQWKEVMGSNPSNFKDCDECPVESVSWNDVQDFIQELNSRTSKNYRLPTEAEWECASKGGKESKGYNHSGNNDLPAVAWCEENSIGMTHPVGTKQPNELGLFDMNGNVWEWCSNGYESYNCYNDTNPSGSNWRVLCGGGWMNTESLSRPSSRDVAKPDNRSWDYGFRLVLTYE
jgi:formylglycine-generating enzyme required for sulfatase activity